MKALGQRGFTLIEILMVILLVAILAAVAVPQFVDFQTEAKNASVAGSIAALRAGITNQYAQMIMRCATTPNTWPTFAVVAANNVAASGPCAAAGVTIPAGQEKFFATAIPENAWGGSATLTDCSVTGGAACTRGDATSCNGTATFTGGWCYNPANGELWADSQLNGTAPFEEGISY